MFVYQIFSNSRKKNTIAEKDLFFQRVAMLFLKHSLKQQRSPFTVFLRAILYYIAQIDLVEKLQDRQAVP